MFHCPQIFSRKQNKNKINPLSSIIHFTSLALHKKSPVVFVGGGGWEGEMGKGEVFQPLAKVFTSQIKPRKNHVETRPPISPHWPRHSGMKEINGNEFFTLISRY